MYKNYCIDYGRRREILQMRLSGHSIVEIANKFGVSRQTIYELISNLPRRKDFPNGDKLKDMEIPDDLAIQVCIQALDRDDVTLISKVNDISRDVIYECFFRVTDRSRSYSSSGKNCRYPGFKNVTAWRRAKNMSLTEMAEKIGKKWKVSYVNLADYFYLMYHMPYEVAESICDITGMTMTEMVSSLFQPDSSDVLLNYVENLKDRNLAASLSGSKVKPPSEDEIEYIKWIYLYTFIIGHKDDSLKQHINKLSKQRLDYLKRKGFE